MRSWHAQSGLSLLGFLFGLLIAGFFAFLVIRVIPAYIEYLEVRQAMKGLALEPGVAGRTPAQIKEDLQKRFDVSYVDTPKRRDMQVTQRDGAVVISVRYESRGPLFGNLEYVATFEHSEPLNRSGP